MIICQVFSYVCHFLSDSSVLSRSIVYYVVMFEL